MRNRHSLAAPVALPFVLGCDDPGTGPEDPLQYFLLSGGNQWTYAPENAVFGDPFSWEVTGRDQDTVTLNRPPGGSHPGPVVLLDHGDQVDLFLDGASTAPFYRISVGASWVHRDPWECDDGPTMVEWWAPGVGLVRWEELNFYAGGPLTFNLVDFDVG